MANLRLPEIVRRPAEGRLAGRRPKLQLVRRLRL